MYVYNLLIADVKIKLKRIKRAKQTPTYDVENIGLEFAVEVKNMFNGLQLAGRESEELWNDIRDILKETADKKVPKAKRKKVSNWLSDEAVKIAYERRNVRSKGDDKEYRRLNAAFQRRARHDKEQSLKEKCRQIEESNIMARTRDLFREIKDKPGSYSARGGAMKLSTGKVVTEEKEVNEIWQQYTEELYRRDPNAADSFVYMCFIDYKKAFDCVDHEQLWVVLRDMGVPVHLIVLLRRLYTNQEATVRTEFGETDNIDIGKGVRQGCILSPLLFNIYAENIMREALEEWKRGISIGGRMVTNLRYADSTTLLAGTKEDLVERMGRVRRASEKAGLYLNVGKTKVMTTGYIGEVVDGKDIEVVTKVVFL